ncbi:MAG: sterol desaturase family protein [Chitinophagales bacterium]
MKSPVFYAIPLFFLFMGLEALFSSLKGRKWYRLNDTLMNLSLGIGSQLFGVASKIVLLGLFALIQQRYSWFEIPNTWWSFILCLLTFDFLFYWAHRFSHEMNFLWGAHVVHHQSDEYNLSVALRQSWIHNLIAFFIFLPIPLLGFQPLTFGLAAGLDTVYQFWIHTKAINKMPRWFEYIMNTPSHHRVHHAVNLKYLDKNHAGVFIIWDRLFGTFQAEENADEIVYGVTTPFTSWSPVWANLHYYVELWRMARLMHWRDRLRLLVARPGWKPDYLGGFQQPQEPTSARKKYNADTNHWLRTYAVAQFIAIIVGAVAFLAFYESISLFYKAFFFAILILSISIIGAIFEKRTWVLKAEYARLLLIIGSLNSFYYYWYHHWMAVMAIGSLVAFVASLVHFRWSIIRSGLVVRGGDMESAIRHR